MAFFSNFQYKTKKSIVYLIWFFKNPIEQIKNLPDWSPRNLFLVHFIFSIISGLLAGIISLKPLNVIFGALAFPFISLVLTLVLSSFLYYYFQVFEKKTVSFVKMFALVVFANFPFYLLQIGSTYIPPISLVGILFTGMLLAVGLTENFGMAKSRSLRLIGGILLIFFIVWLMSKLSMQKTDHSQFD